MGDGSRWRRHLCGSAVTSLAAEPLFLHGMSMPIATCKMLAKVRAKLPKSVSSPINAAKRHKKNKDQLAFSGPTPAEMVDSGTVDIVNSSTRPTGTSRDATIRRLPLTTSNQRSRRRRRSSKAKGTIYLMEIPSS